MLLFLLSPKPQKRYYATEWMITERDARLSDWFLRYGWELRRFLFFPFFRRSCSERHFIFALLYYWKFAFAICTKKLNANLYLITNSVISMWQQIIIHQKHLLHRFRSSRMLFFAVFLRHGPRRKLRCVFASFCMVCILLSANFHNSVRFICFAFSL